MSTSKTITAKQAKLITSGVAMLRAADPSDQQADKAKSGFSMVLYTGSVFAGHWYWGNVYLDVSGFKPTRQDLPALLRHEPSKVCGWTESLSADSSAATISAAGRFLEGDATTEPYAVLVKGRLAQGFPYQCSGSWRPITVEEVQADGTAKVNGKTVQGPCTIFREFTLAEASFAELGWDPMTSAEVDASAVADAPVTVNLMGQQPQGKRTMANATSASVTVLAQLRDIVGADKAVDLIAAKPEATDLAVFAPEIAAAVKDTRTQLDAAQSQIATLKTDLAKATAAPVVVTAKADPSQPTAQVEAGSEADLRAQFAGSKDLQAEFQTVEKYLFYVQREAAKSKGA